MLQRRRPDAPVRTGFSIPEQLDRADFARPDAPWLVAVFTSATCATCADVVDEGPVLASDDVAVQEVEYGARPRAARPLRRSTPCPRSLVADAHGVVQRSFLGPVSATHLWAALAEVRGEAVPPDCGASTD